MIVLVSLIVLLRGFHCFHDFSHGASLHPFSLNPVMRRDATVLLRMCIMAVYGPGAHGPAPFRICVLCFIEDKCI